MIGDLLEALDQIEADIDSELGNREVLDSHDYSSSSYSAYDDGFNAGVCEATEAFRERLERVLRAKVIESRAGSPDAPRSASVGR